MNAQMHDRTLGVGGSFGALVGAATGAGLLIWAAMPAHAALPAGGFADLAEKVTPAVVNISSTREQVAGGPGMGPDMSMEDFLRRFQEQQSPQNPQPVTALGSGFVISADGYVVTNNHVIEGADVVTVNFADGSSLTADVVGVDPQTDVALLKVESDEELPFVSFGNSDALRVGDYVMAVGNPFGLGGTVTAGIVSARGRDIHAGPYDDFIQTDAAINRGNSGGPMFNTDGEVVGVNTAIVSPSGGSVGIGFAIPSNMVEVIVADLKDDGIVERGWLGVRIQQVDEELREALRLDEAAGALVSEVMPESPAEAAGLRQGDVILAFDGKEIEEIRDLTRAVAAVQPGETTGLTVWRKGERQELEVTVDAQEAAQVAAVEGAPKAQQQSERLGARLAPLDAALKEQLGLDSETSGVVLVEVDPRGPAAARGLAAGDVIESIDDTAVQSAADVETALKSAEGGFALILVNRAGQERYVAWSTKDA